VELEVKSDDVGCYRLTTLGSALGSNRARFFPARKRIKQCMESITNVFIRVREFALRRTHGQTITEYTRPGRELGA